MGVLFSSYLLSSELSDQLVVQDDRCQRSSNSFKSEESLSATSSWMRLRRFHWQSSINLSSSARSLKTSSKLSIRFSLPDRSFLKLLFIWNGCSRFMYVTQGLPHQLHRSGFGSLLVATPNTVSFPSWSPITGSPCRKRPEVGQRLIIWIRYVRGVEWVVAYRCGRFGCHLVVEDTVF